MNQLKRYLKIYWLFCKSVFMLEMKTLSYVIFQMLFALLLIVAEVSFFLILFRQTATLRGWTLEWMLVFYATSKFIDNGYWILFSRNFNRISRYISHGLLDTILTKPLDSQFFCTTRWFRPADIVPVIVTFGVLIFSFVNLSQSPGPAQLIMWTILCLAGLIIHYSFSLLMTLPSFWFDQFYPMTLVIPLIRFAKYPLDVYSPILRFIFSTFFPIVLALSIPAKFLKGDGISWLVLYTCVLAAFLLWLSRKLWFVALRKYSSASS